MKPETHKESCEHKDCNLTYISCDDKENTNPCICFNELTKCEHGFDKDFSCTRCFEARLERMEKRVEILEVVLGHVARYAHGIEDRRGELTSILCENQ